MNFKKLTPKIVLFSFLFSTVYTLYGPDIPVIKSQPSAMAATKQIRRETSLTPVQEEIKEKADKVIKECDTTEWIYVSGASEDDYRTFFSNYLTNNALSYAPLERYVTLKSPDNGHWDEIYKKKRGIIAGPGTRSVMEHSAANKREAERILKEEITIDSTQSEREQVRKIISYITDHSEYAPKGQETDPDTWYAGSVFLGDGITTCTGYTESFYDLCLASGIDCEIVLGYTPESEYHAFNRCLFKDGTWYYFDLTFADGTVAGNGYNHKYTFQKKLWDGYKITATL